MKPVIYRVFLSMFLTTFSGVAVARYMIDGCFLSVSCGEINWLKVFVSPLILAVIPTISFILNGHIKLNGNVLSYASIQRQNKQFQIDISRPCSIREGKLVMNIEQGASRIYFIKIFYKKSDVRNLVSLCGRHNKSSHSPH